jgi:hypothetical protein
MGITVNAMAKTIISLLSYRSISPQPEIMLELLDSLAGLLSENPINPQRFVNHSSRGLIQKAL